MFLLWNYQKEEMFLKAKVSENENSLLNLAEKKFYEKGLVPPCLFWFLQALNLARYRVISRAEMRGRAQSYRGNIRDFKIRDATASRTRWLISGLGLERRRLSGKSKIRIPVWQDDATAKRSVSVWFFGISFAEIAMA